MGAICSGEFGFFVGGKVEEVCCGELHLRLALPPRIEERFAPFQRK